MRDIPLVFPIALVVIVVLTFFTGAFAVSANAQRNDGQMLTVSLVGGGSLEPAQTSEQDWYESAAIWVCPLH
jgi:hypothetical protein